MDSTAANKISAELNAKNKADEEILWGFTGI